MTFDQPEDELASTARRARIALTCGMVAAAFIALALVAPWSLDEGWLEIRASADGLSDRSAALIGAMVVAIVLFSLFQVRAVLKLVESGDAFGSEARTRLVRAAALMVLACAADVLLPALARILGFGASGSGISLTGSDALGLLSASTFYFVAKLLERAAVFEVDSREIV